MKRILGIAEVLGLVGSITFIAGCSKKKAPQTKESSWKEEVFDLGKGIKLEMVLVPAGKFNMGFTKKEMEDLKVALQKLSKKNRKKELEKEDFDLVDQVMSSQGKQHEVTLTKPYYLGKYEVTQEQWESVMGNNPSFFKGAQLPVTNVSWEDCREFIKKLNANTKNGYQLPTEAEWEYACRAGTSTAYSIGDNITPNDANYDDSKITKTVKIGIYEPNAFGLYDMHGNVWEWCEDWCGISSVATVSDPKVPAMGENRVMRGGSFGNGASMAGSSFRLSDLPTRRSYNIGLRLARTP